MKLHDLYREWVQIDRRRRRLVAVHLSERQLCEVLSSVRPLEEQERLSYGPDGQRKIFGCEVVVTLDDTVEPRFLTASELADYRATLPASGDRKGP